MINKIVEVIYECNSDDESCCKDKAEKILDLRYDCPKSLRIKATGEIVCSKDCPTCNGTGNGEKCLAVLAENQELPRCNENYNHIELAIYVKAQSDMTTPYKEDGKTVKWVKIILEEK